MFWQPILLFGIYDLCLFYICVYICVFYFVFVYQNEFLLLVQYLYVEEEETTVTKR